MQISDNGKVISFDVDEYKKKETQSKKALTALLAKDIVNNIDMKPGILGVNLQTLNRTFRAKGKADYESKKNEYLEILKKLEEYDIDPVMYNMLEQNETDRKLKKEFGQQFIILTIAFTLLSYAIVILDGIRGWHISPTAITALIIETPIQFIGILYIIARNLFPQRSSEKAGDEAAAG